jgi:hypothetical protein
MSNVSTTLFKVRIARVSGGSFSSFVQAAAGNIDCGCIFIMFVLSVSGTLNIMNGVSHVLKVEYHSTCYQPIHFL